MRLSDILISQIIAIMLTIVMVATLSGPTYAQVSTDSAEAIRTSSLPATPDSSASSFRVDSTVSRLKRVVSSVIDYFGKANVPRTDGKLDVSFIGGPYYSSDTNFGIGIVAAGHYGIPLYNADSSKMVMSDASLFLNVAVSGCLTVGARGTHVFKNDRRRINYITEFANDPRHFWGIGYDCGKNRKHFSDYDQISFSIKGSYEWRVWNNFFLGPMMRYDLISAKNVEYPEFWNGQKTSTSSLGIGAVVSLDSRDNMTAPKRGFLARVEFSYYPSFTARPAKSFTTLDISGSHYRPVWRGGVLAMRLHAMMTTGDAPWSMRATFGGSSSMRGYYFGQYRDKDEIDLTLELRQHVWRRSGAVVWIGAGTVFPKFTQMRWYKVLPNAGIGYRWEFKKNSNVRVDLGIGRGQTAFIFNINEAF